MYDSLYYVPDKHACLHTAWTRAAIRRALACGVHPIHLPWVRRRTDAQAGARTRTGARRARVSAARSRALPGAGEDETTATPRLRRRRMQTRRHQARRASRQGASGASARAARSARCPLHSGAQSARARRWVEMFLRRARSGCGGE
jgi:hypothetical protein